jgi:hypothetical protein
LVPVSEETDRLRALLAVMREFGVTKLVTPDGYILEAPPLTPLEQALASAKQDAKTSKANDDDEDLDGDEKREESLQAEWNEFWSRATRSSGAPIPRFPGADKAAAFLARH